MIEQEEMKKPRVMNRFFFWLAIFVSILIVALYLSPNFINKDNIKNAIISKIKSEHNVDLVVKGSMGLSVNPFFNEVALNFNDVSISDELRSCSISNLIVSFDILSFFFGNRSISMLQFERLVFKNKNIIKNGELLASIFKEENKTLKKIVLLNSRIEYYYLDSTRVFDQLNAEIYLSGNRKTISADGLVNQDNISIEAEVEDPIDITKNNFAISLSQMENKEKFTGNFSINNNKLEVSGKSEAIINTPGIFISSFVENSSLLTSLSQESLAYPLSIGADIKLKDDIIYFSNISAHSERIEGKGNIEFNIHTVDDLKVNFVFSKMNLAGLVRRLTDDNSNIDDLVDERIVDSLIDTSFLRKNINLNISIDDFSIQNSHAKNINFLLELKNKRVVNSKFSATLTENDSFVNVNVSNFTINEDQDKLTLVSNLEADTSNINSLIRSFKLENYVLFNDDTVPFTIKSSIKISNDNIIFDNIDALIGKNTLITGAYGIEQKKLLSFSSDLKVSNFDFKSVKFPLFITRYQILTQPSENNNFFSSFTWFRDVSSTYDMKIDINQPSEEEGISNLYSYQLFVEPGKWTTKGKVKEKVSDYEFSLEVLVQAIKPKISLLFSGNKLDLNSLRNFLYESKLYQSDIDKSKNSTGEKPNNLGFNFSVIKKSYFTLGVDLEKLIVNQKNFNNLKIESHTNANVFYIDNLYFSYLDGQFKSMGNVSFYDNTLYQLSYNTAGINIRDLAKDFLDKDIFLSGPLASSGSVVSEGSSFDEVITNMNASIDIHLPAVKVSGFAADTVVDIALKRKAFDRSNILQLLKASLSSGETNITNFYGTGKIENKVITSSDITFNTSYNTAAMAFSFNLENFDIYTNLKFAFMPYNRKKPVEYSFTLTGNMLSGVNKQADTSDLIDFVKNEYSLAATFPPTVNSMGNSKPVDNPGGK